MTCVRLALVMADPVYRLAGRENDLANKARGNIKKNTSASPATIQL